MNRFLQPIQMRDRSAQKYRYEIDGLRAIAVLIVLLFHLEIPGFSGGFIGVDIFFVISGYLITNQITYLHQSGCFSFKEFYLRRARRLLPALYFTIIICFIFLALVPIIGIEVKGSKRWLDFYFFRLQPIEILKPFFILVTVKILTIEKLKNSQTKYLLSFLLLFCVIILLIDQLDLEF